MTHPPDHRVAKAIAIAKIVCPRCGETNFIELEDVAPRAMFSCQKCRLRYGLSTEASPRNLALENAVQGHANDQVGGIDLSEVYRKWADIRTSFGHGESDERALVREISGASRGKV